MRDRSFIAIAILHTLAGAHANDSTSSPASESGKAFRAADTILTDGKIYTADSNRSFAQAMAVSGGEIVYIGDNAGAASFQDESAEVVDLKGALVLPGLHDTHIHPISSMEIDECSLENEPKTLGEISRIVRRCLTQFPVEDGEWLTVSLWNFAVGNQPSGEFKTVRAALDAASRETPIILLGSDGHHYAVNSAVLAKAKNKDGDIVGATSKTLATDFAELAHYFGTDADGEPDGRITEDYALALLGGESLLTAGLEARLAQPERLLDVTLPRGVTSFLHAAAAPEMLSIYDKLLADDQLHARVTLALYFDPNAYARDDNSIDFDRMIGEASEIRKKYANAKNIKATFLKLFADGVLEGDPLAIPPTLPNAALSREYHQPIFNLDFKNQSLQSIEIAGYADLDGPACETARAQGASVDVAAFMAEHGFHPAQCKRSAGVLQHAESTIFDYVRAGDAAGFTFLIHAIGDRAVTTALNAIEAAQRANKSASQHIVTHLHLVNPADFSRFADLGAYASFTFAWALTDYAYDMTIIPFIDKLASMRDLYDPSGYYVQNAYPAGSIQQAGGVLIAGSDAPVDTRDPRPFTNIAVAVARDDDPGDHSPPPLNAEQAINIYDAVDAYTINAARALRQSDITGSLEVGKRADFIVLSHDIFEMAATLDGPSEASLAHEIADTLVLQTWFDGRKVYEYDGW